MCGIFGIISKRGELDIQDLLSSGATALAHRGPDGRGQWVRQAGGWDAGLCHTRLSIQDLSTAGSQPMLSDSGHLCISFNGEIYNHLELRRELTAEYPFAGHSDTETIVAGIQMRGHAFSKRLRGMYAYGLVDTRLQCLRLVRDPFGIKPLYYYASDELFVFSSEIRAILKMKGLRNRWQLSRPALECYLETGAPGEQQSIVEGIRSVGAGEELSVDFGGEKLSVSRVDMDDSWRRPVAIPTTREDAVRELRGKLQASVRSHLLSDVPVGVFLSGGIDSSALLALMREVESRNIQTFTVSFGDSELSEGSQAREIAANFGAEHREVLLSEEGVVSSVPSALRAMDQPTMDGVNTYVVSEAVRSAGLKVALSGLGGDEVFCGYPSFRRRAQLARLGFLGGAAGQVLAGISRAFGMRTVAWEKAVDLLLSGGDPAGVYQISRRMFPATDVDNLLAGGSHRREEVSTLPTDGTNAISVLEITRYMRNTLLRDCDVMSMAHSLEVRVPFVDVDLCRYTLSLPGEWKMNGSRPKPLLLDALGSSLPGYVWNRPKMGFTLPFARWMLGTLREEINETLQDRAALEGCGLQAKPVMRVWDDFQKHPGRWRWSRPWSLYVLARWCREHGVTV